MKDALKKYFVAKLKISGFVLAIFGWLILFIFLFGQFFEQQLLALEIILKSNAGEIFEMNMENLIEKIHNILNQKESSIQETSPILNKIFFNLLKVENILISKKIKFSLGTSFFYIGIKK